MLSEQIRASARTIRRSEEWKPGNLLDAISDLLDDFAEDVAALEQNGSPVDRGPVDQGPAVVIPFRKPFVRTKQDAEGGQPDDAA